MTSTHRIAVIAGDGVGKEVVPEGIKVIEAALPGMHFELFGCGSDHCAKTATASTGEVGDAVAREVASR